MSSELQQKLTSTINIGIVCTAYSNGAFMDYVRNNLNNIGKLVIAKTGVKNLKILASTFDLAIEYESNGHGFISYSEELTKKISNLNSYCLSSKDILTLELLSAYIALYNPTVGDSLSNIVAMECGMKFFKYLLCFGIYLW